MFICEEGLPPQSIPHLNTLPTRIKYSKFLFNSRNYKKIFREISKKLRVEKNRFDRFCTVRYTAIKFLNSVEYSLKLLFKNGIK